MEEIKKIDHKEIEGIISHGRKRFLVYVFTIGISLCILHPMLRILIWKENLTMADLTFNIFYVLYCSVFLILLHYFEKYFIYISYTMLIPIILGSLNLAFDSPQAPLTQNFIFLTSVPAATFFLYGKRIGMVVTVIFLLAVFIYNNFFAHFYPTTAVFQLTFTFAALILLFYLYEDTKDKSQTLIKKREDELWKTNQLLKQEIQIRTAAQEQLDKNLKQIIKQRDELEEMNKLMVGRELKMAELKKEIEKLKSQ